MRNPIFEFKKKTTVLLEAPGGHRKGHPHAAQQEGDWLMKKYMAHVLVLNLYGESIF